MTGSGTNQIDAPRWQRLSASRDKRLAFETPSWDRYSPLLEGHMQFAELQPGMRLRLTSVSDSDGLVTHDEWPAGVKITLVVAGETRVRYHHQAATLGPSAPSAGLLVTLPEATEFTRQGRPGGYERILTLSLTPDWLMRHDSPWPSMQGREPQVARWSPSPGLLALAARLFDARVLESQDGAHHLQLAGFALSMAGEAFATGDGHCQERNEDHFVDGDRRPTERRPTDRRLQRLMALIDSGEAYRSSQTDLARRLGMSLSSLQRRFRAHHGESLGRFLRRRRLAIANAALDEGVSIEAAATLAGYTSAANFATAFKREFGAQPSKRRQAAVDINSA